MNNLELMKFAIKPFDLEEIDTLGPQYVNIVKAVEIENFEWLPEVEMKNLAYGIKNWIVSGILIDYMWKIEELIEKMEKVSEENFYIEYYNIHHGI